MYLLNFACSRHGARVSDLVRFEEETLKKRSCAKTLPVTTASNAEIIPPWADHSEHIPSRYNLLGLPNVHIVQFRTSISHRNCQRNSLHPSSTQTDELRAHDAELYLSSLLQPLPRPDRCGHLVSNEVVEERHGSESPARAERHRRYVPFMKSQVQCELQAMKE